jgi:hypothetical protein
MTSITKTASLACLCAAVTAGPQTTGQQAAAAATADKEITMTGCVTRTATDGTYTLSDLSTMPAHEAGASAAAEGAGVHGMPGSALGAAAGAAGGAAGAAAGAAGPIAGARGVPSPGSTARTAEQLTSGTTPAGYRLSGTDMSPYAGKRVEIVGVPVRSANPAAGAAAIRGVPGAVGTAGTLAGAAAPPELRVRTVKPIRGSCP